MAVLVPLRLTSQPTRPVPAVFLTSSQRTPQEFPCTTPEWPPCLLFFSSRNLSLRRAVAVQGPPLTLFMNVLFAFLKRPKFFQDLVRGLVDFDESPNFLLLPKS